MPRPRTSLSLVGSITDQRQVRLNFALDLGKLLRAVDVGNMSYPLCLSKIRARVDDEIKKLALKPTRAQLRAQWAANLQMEKEA